MQNISHTPIARNTDPVSSHLAAAEITSKGIRGSQRGKVLDMVFSRPGMTSRELAYLFDMDRYIVARRLPELEAYGRVYKGPIVRCAVGKRKAVSWWPVKG